MRGHLRAVGYGAHILGIHGKCASTQAVGLRVRERSRERLVGVLGQGEVTFKVTD